MSVYCSLIKHAKISQSQSLLECFKLFDWLKNVKAAKMSTNQKIKNHQKFNKLMKMRNAESCLKGATVITPYSLAAYSKIVRTSVKLGKTKLFPLVLLRAQGRISEQAFNWSLVGLAMIWNCWGSLRWDDRRSLLSKRTNVTTQHVSVVWAFLQK